MKVPVAIIIGAIIIALAIFFSVGYDSNKSKCGDRDSEDYNPFCAILERIEKDK